MTLRAGDDPDLRPGAVDAWEPTARTWKPRRIRRRLEAPPSPWRSWSALHQRYDGPLRDLVHHSGVVLQGLTFARTGAVVAAPTTSLPEGVGSGRTWDYRYSWVRDASMTLQALFLAACPDEAGRFFSFLATAAATQLDRGVSCRSCSGSAASATSANASCRTSTGLARQRTGPGRQRRVGPAPARRVRRAARRGVHTARAARRPRRPDPAVPGRRGGRRRRPLGDDDQGIWEIRGPGPAVPAQQADVLGGARPRPGDGRLLAARRRPVRDAWTRVTRGDPGGDPAPRGGARRPAPTPSPSAPTSSTPRCC